jgi:diaminopimelate decarboxylase
MPLPCPLPLPALESLAAEYGTPLQLYDEAGIARNARSLLTAFGGALPGFRQFFAVKALPNPAVLRVLLDAGCGLDCSSPSELHVAAALRAPPDAVIFTSNFSSGAELCAAADAGYLVNLDSAEQLAALLAARRASGGRGAPARLCFRLNPGLGRTDSESASNVLGGPAAKFGAAPDSVVAAYGAARDAGARHFGMHMMTGSCVLDDGYWGAALDALVRAAAAVERATGIELEFLNIGGGMGIPYKPGTPAVDAPALAAKLAAALAAARAAHGLRAAPAVHMENGRFMTGPFGWLVARCQADKAGAGAGGARYLGLDACMAHLMRPGMYGAYHHVTVPGRERDGGPRAPAHVVGTLCENNDWFARDRDLPADARVGDLVIIHDTGAHSHSMGFQYNGKLRAPELLIRAAPGAGVQLIRERETVEDLFDNCRMPADLLEPAAAAAAGADAAYPYVAGRAARRANARAAAAAAPAARMAVVAAAIAAAAVASLATWAALRARPAARA